MRNVLTLSALLLVLSLATVCCGQQSWTVQLAENATVSGDVVRLKDIVTQPVLEKAADLVVLSGGRPGRQTTVLRRGILRQLVSAGLAGGVRLAGAEKCQITFAGSKVSAEALHQEVRRVIQPLVGPAVAGAPNSWFEIDIPDRQISADSGWQVSIDRTNKLTPGRNLIRVRLDDGQHTEVINATVQFHVFGEVARVRGSVGRGQSLEDVNLDWEWRDLAEDCSGLMVGRHTLSGTSARRTLANGVYLRTSDLKSTPIVEAGQPVELKVMRGTVAVTVRAFARQDGTLGQTIPVLNELTGRLVNARVAAPGLVEWRR